MSQQIMCWRHAPGYDEKILHIWHTGGWKPYFSTPYHVSDYGIPKGSKGYATFQSLHRQGWKVVPFNFDVSPLMPDSEKVAYLDSVSQGV